jgi:UDP-glucuronate decarboxylase
MIELAQEIKDLTGSSSPIVHQPLPMDDPLRRQPDIRMAEELLGGWKPSVQIKDGLSRTIEYFNQILSMDIEND